MKRSDTRDPTDKLQNGLAFIGYNADDKAYTYYGIEAGLQVPITLTGTVQGDNELSPTSYTYKSESSLDVQDVDHHGRGQSDENA